MIKIALIPIDNRPICYDLIQDVLALDEDIELFMPKIEYLGGLQTSANIEKIFEFLTNLNEIDYLVVSLDTLAYGGLVNSRRCDDGFEIIKKRIEKFREIALKKCKKVLAFSSIMRISNNNINEEEKEYWAQWGKRIFDRSYFLHKSEVEKTANCVINKVPDEILNDYISTRKRNFEINKIYLNLAQEGFFDTLIFSKDDCAEFGLNVKEANELQKEVDEKNIQNVLIKTGADEIPLALVTRALAQNENIKINPVFIEEDGKNKISKYEDISLLDCVKSQIEIANCGIDEKNFDLTLLINNFKNKQGDLVLGDIINNIDKEIDFLKTPYFIADANNANGADCNFIQQLFKQNLDSFYGYCGYNTSANTLGCAIFCAVVKFLALKKNTYNNIAFKKIQAIRFLDDWAYQAISRKFVRENAPDFQKALGIKKEELNKNFEKISKFLDYKPEKIEYSLPWDRSFEIRIKLG